MMMIDDDPDDDFSDCLWDKSEPILVDDRFHLLSLPGFLLQEEEEEEEEEEKEEEEDEEEEKEEEEKDDDDMEPSNDVLLFLQLVLWGRLGSLFWEGTVHSLGIITILVKMAATVRRGGWRLDKY